MARKIYKRVGIRKDKNLGDLSNTTDALNNLIDTLVDDARSTFVSEDLDALRTMSSQRLTHSVYSRIIGSKTTFTNQNGINLEYLPRITYQNQFDQFKVFAGDPFVDGGNGLTAKYFDYTDVLENSIDIFSGFPIKVDNFWEAGNFIFTDKLIPELTTVNGGVEWEGYFIPTSTGAHTFNIDSSGCFTFDFESSLVSAGSSVSVGFNVQQNAAATANTITFTAASYPTITFTSSSLGSTSRMINYDVDYTVKGTGGFQILESGSRIGLDDSGGTGIKDYDYNDLSINASRGSFFFRDNTFYYRLSSYDEISRIGLSTVVSASGTVGANAFTLSSTPNVRYVAIGQTVSGTGIATGALVNGIDRSTGVISLTPPTGEPYVVKSTFSGNVTFRKNLGDSTSISYTTPVLVEYQKYPIRFRYFIPSASDATNVERYINFDVRYPTDSVFSNLSYTKLYSLDYPFNVGTGVFPVFVSGSILSGGGTIGGSTNPNNYVRVSTSKRFDVRYQPKASISDITKASTTATVTSGRNTMSISNTSNIEVGNYVYGSGIANGTRVDEIRINSSIVLNKNVDPILTATSDALSSNLRVALPLNSEFEISNKTASFTGSPNATTVVNYSAGGTITIENTVSKFYGFSARKPIEIPQVNVFKESHIDVNTGSGTQIGTGNYCIEAWIYTEDFNFGGQPNINFCFPRSRNGGVTDLAVGFVPYILIQSNTIRVLTPSDGFICQTGGVLSANRWHHIAVTRSSSTVRIFVDGILQTSGSDSSNYYGYEYWFFASIRNFTTGFYFQDVRVYAGAAKYTSNFTPPSSMFQYISTTATGTYRFMDHRGFVKQANGNASSGTITLNSGDTTSLAKDMIVFAPGFQQFTKIQSISSSKILTITPSQSVGAGTTFYFYYSKGLVNNGLTEFCIPAETKCMLITADTPAGSTVIPVTDSTGVGNGWSVQGFQFASGTTVSGAPTSATSITISTPTTSNLVSGANFTVSSASGDRTLCCPPTDTSPPFNPTLEGLETTSVAPNLRLESGNLSFDALKAVISEANITSYSSTNTSKSRLSIQTPSGTFKILCS